MQEKNTRGRTKFVIIVMLSVFAIVLMIFVNGIQNIGPLPEIVMSTDSFLAEDSGLFDREYVSQLKPNRVYFGKDMPTVSLIYFGNNYHIFIYPIDLVGDISLRKLLSVSIEESNVTNLKPYFTINHDQHIKYQYLQSPRSPVSKIFMTLSGDSLQNVFENDSIACFHLQCKDLSIRYLEEGPVSIFIEGGDRPLGYTIIPTDLMLLKRQKKVYFLIMTPNNFKKGIPRDLLYNIVRKN